MSEIIKCPACNMVIATCNCAELSAENAKLVARIAALEAAGDELANAMILANGVYEHPSVTLWQKAKGG